MHSRYTGDQVPNPSCPAIRILEYCPGRTEHLKTHGRRTDAISWLLAQKAPLTAADVKHAAICAGSKATIACFMTLQSARGSDMKSPHKVDSSEFVYGTTWIGSPDERVRNPCTCCVSVYMGGGGGGGGAGSPWALWSHWNWCPLQAAWAPRLGVAGYQTPCRNWAAPGASASTAARWGSLCGTRGRKPTAMGINEEQRSVITFQYQAKRYICWGELDHGQTSNRRQARTVRIALRNPQ